MKNKVELKKHLLSMGLLVSVMLVLMIALHFQEFYRYTRAYNIKLSAMTMVIRERYPNITEQEIMELFHAKEETEEWSVLEGYGIDLEKDSVIIENQENFWHYLYVDIFLVLLTIGSTIGIFLKYNREKDKELQEITKCIEEINQKNYHLELDDISEDELSILKSEVYKTMVMLKEVAENSKKDKENLKQSLSDISHQLKTPLTSILVILDNLIDDPDMDPEIRLDFLHDIKREVSNIHFLVQSLLKLSKLDSDTVVFFREEIPVSKILDKVVQNTGVLCDLKNIDIQREGLEEAVIYCDFRWQVEALTNILKNCVEYSEEGGMILVQTQKNQVYTSITIRDFGQGIDEEDQKHIFERFYKGKNSTSESVGIGLALAKAIIKSDNGAVTVEREQPGTQFVIKYYQ